MKPAAFSALFTCTAVKKSSVCTCVDSCNFFTYKQSIMLPNIWCGRKREVSEDANAGAAEEEQFRAFPTTNNSVATLATLPDDNFQLVTSYDDDKNYNRA